MATAARDDDMMNVTIQTHYPRWLDDLDEDEFENAMKAARDKATIAFVNKLVEIEKFWRARKMAVMAGQTDIYDYV